MPSRLILAVFSLFIFSAPGLAADQGLYLDLHGGNSDQDDIALGALELTFDSGYMFGVSAGYDLGSLRTELEITHRSNDLDTMSVFGSRFDGRGDVSFTALFVNAIFEFDNRTPLIPYLGLGLGWGALDFDNVSGGGAMVELSDDTGVAMQFMLGLGYDLSKRWRANLDLRGVYAPIATEDDPDNEDDDDDYFSSGVSLGVSYYF